MPAEPKLTPWFDWPAKPTLRGWYDVRIHIGASTCTFANRLWWNGACFWSDDNCEPLSEWRLVSGDQWRGLAEKPKEQGNDN